MPEDFVTRLSAYRRAAVFNPWGESDPLHDLDDNGPVVRSRQLIAYLRERIGRAHTLLLAEAIGYQGGHFSGIPMTSERLLLGGLRHKQIEPGDVFGLKPQRTSSVQIKRDGFTEPTATIVWGLFKEQGLDPRSCVLWNAFPWHPFRSDRGLLSNRTPRPEELAEGHLVLREILALGRFKQIVAVGRKSAAQLDELGIKAHEVRHPANGGAGKFRAQMRVLLESP